MMENETAREGAGPTLGESNPPPMAHINIREARAQLSQLVSDMESSPSVITLGRRNLRSAVLASFARFEPVLSGDYKTKMAFFIVENLLAGAPLHIRKPQIEELAHASKDDLLLLARVEKLPMDRRTEDSLRKSLGDARLLDRLLKRSRIALAIAAARAEGLYEAAEDLTGRVDLATDDSKRVVD
jgi:hypothetical protein